MYNYNGLGFAWIGIGAAQLAAGNAGIALLHFLTAMAYFAIVLRMTQPTE